MKGTLYPPVQVPIRVSSLIMCPTAREVTDTCDVVLETVSGSPVDVDRRIANEKRVIEELEPEHVT